MSDNSTVARPYARAIFEFALDSKQLDGWSRVLQLLALCAENELASKFIKNPASSVEQRSEIFLITLDLLDVKIDENLVANFLSLLAENNRLQVLPDIFSQYEVLRENYEKVVDVQVISYSSLTKSQEEKLIEKLSERLQRSVSLKVSIDKSLQGGAIIRAGHLVFDASVKAQIKKLSSSLAA